VADQVTETAPSDARDDGPFAGEALARALAVNTIADRASFVAIAGPPHDVAGLYFYAQLDCLVELARHVARDFFARPHLYTEIADGDIPPALARLDSRIGTEEFFLSRAQRTAIFAPVFGGSDAADQDFVRLRDGLLEAATAFAEWSQATGIPMLRERVRTAHRPFREYLEGVGGASVNWSRQQALPALTDDLAYRILRDPNVIAVFGLTRTPVGDWPFTEDANGDKVVEEISKQFRTDATPYVTREAFSALQRVALRGAEALAAILDFREDADDATLDQLITRCYTWYAALRARDMPAAVSGTRNGARA
jgi:hypothetical protein